MCCGTVHCYYGLRNSPLIQLWCKKNEYFVSWICKTVTQLVKCFLKARGSTPGIRGAGYGLQHKMSAKRQDMADNCGMPLRSLLHELVSGVKIFLAHCGRIKKRFYFCIQCCRRPGCQRSNLKTRQTPQFCMLPHRVPGLTFEVPTYLRRPPLDSLCSVCG